MTYDETEDRVARAIADASGASSYGFRYTERGEEWRAIARRAIAAYHAALMDKEEKPRSS